MTKQEIFDKVVRALIEQGRPSVDPITGFCLYRGPDGVKCAAGFLIPDERYQAIFEDQDIYSLADWGAFDDYDADLMDLFQSLQHAHDNAASRTINPDKWVHLFLKNAARVAHEHELTFRF